MSFTTLPPEINSGLMYAGPGSASLTAAATAWHGLAEDLTHTAASVQSVLAGLSGSYQGPSAAAMTTAVTPFATWLGETAGLAQELGTQATAQAGLYEAAHAAVVPPPVIAVNRAQLLALIATNLLGQNAPAIAANEAQYDAYWAHDGATMDTYAAASSHNVASMQQPTQPPAVASTAQAMSAQAGGVTSSTTGDATSGGLSFSTIGSTLDSLGLSSVADSLPAALAATPLSEVSSLSTFAYLPARFAMMPLSTLMSMMMRMAQMGGSMGSAASLAGQTAGATGTGTLMTQIGEFVNGKLQGAVGTLVGHFNTATQQISAKLGQAASMGALKVPQGWSSAAEGMMRAAPVLPHTTVSAPVQTMSATSGLPGGPFGNAMMGAMAGRGLGAVAAKAPKIIPKSPAGG